MGGKLTIRRLSTPGEMLEVERLQTIIWPGSEVDIVPSHLMLTVAHNGGVAIGACDGDQMVGFVFGFLGTDSASPNRPAMARLKHCSHMLGVDPRYRDAGVGFALKCAQREAVIEQGIRLVTWTYDPLESRNAYLNVRRLGAVCRTYLREAYGPMRDALNQGLPSDRFQVDWWVTSPRVRSRIDGTRPPLDLANFLDAGVSIVNAAELREDGLPRPSPALQPLTGNMLLVEIPPVFSDLRRKDLPLAGEWRVHTRHIFESAFAQGYLVTDFVHLKGERAPRSFYLLSQGEAQLG